MAYIITIEREKEKTNEDKYSPSPEKLYEQKVEFISISSIANLVNKIEEEGQKAQLMRVLEKCLND